MGRKMKAAYLGVAAGLLASLASLLTALQGENTGFGTITDSQWVTAVLFFCVGTAGVGTVAYQLRSGPSSQGEPSPKTRDEAPPPDGS